MLSQIDNAIQQRLGLPYLYLTRDYNIHSRCRYLIHKLRQLPGNGLRLLDAGCGSGLAIRHLTRSLPGKVTDYVGIDLAARRLVPRYRNLRRLRVEFLDIALDDDWWLGTFDVVWCSEVMEHLLNDRGLLAKLKAALKPGGTLLVTAPSLDFVKHVGRHYSPILQTSPRQDGGHVRHGYRREDLARLAEQCDLQLVTVAGVNRLTVAQTRARYDSAGLRRVVVNLRQSLRHWRGRDFAEGQAFLTQPEAFHSIAAEFRRPVAEQSPEPSWPRGRADLSAQARLAAS